jgi:hypothetical protein
MKSYMEAFLKTSIGLVLLDEAEHTFADSTFDDLTPEDLQDWAGRIASKIWRVASTPVRTAANDVNTQMKEWQSNPRSLTSIGSLERAFDAMAEALKDNPLPVKNLGESGAFKDSCYSTMVTMAVCADDIKRGQIDPVQGRIDPVGVTIARARTASVCDGYLDQFGDIPPSARIGIDDKASEYWAAKMAGAAPLNETERERILANLQKLETSTKIDDIAPAMTAILQDLNTVIAKNGADDYKGIAEMVFAEAMRSNQVMPGGAYRKDQPAGGAPIGALSEQELADMDKVMKDRWEERKKEETEDPTHSNH